MTQSQWLAVMGSWPIVAPSLVLGLGDAYPAYYVSWYDCQNFINPLNTHLASTGQGAGVRLPTEAEWEYACRAGTTTRFFFGDSPSVDDNWTDGPTGSAEYPGNHGDYMWFGGNNSPSGSKPVGTKQPNAWGLHDMSGNVWEWWHDYFHDNYIGAPEDEDAWLTPTASYRVLRGGSWNNVASGYRSVSRGHHVTPDSGYLIIGFRLALTP